MGFIPNHNSYGVSSTDYDGALFSVKAVLVLKHNLQNIMAVLFYLHHRSYQVQQG